MVVEAVCAVTVGLMVITEDPPNGDGDTLYRVMGVHLVMLGLWVFARVVRSFMAPPSEQ